MSLSKPGLSVLAVSALLAGCAHVPFDRSVLPSNRGPDNPSTVAGVVITGTQLAADPTQSVLDAIQRAMPQVRPSKTALGACPSVVLRGHDSIVGTSQPTVYVDGQRTVDTCPLSDIQAVDAERVEVYPLGVTSRPGYASHGHGLILIFLQRAGGSGTQVPGN